MRTELNIASGEVMQLWQTFGGLLAFTLIHDIKRGAK